MFFFLSTFWFIRTIKVVLFYFYFWQLKEYHIGRFKDHLRTYKGRKLIINNLILVKLIILFPFLIILVLENKALSQTALIIIFLLYFIESLVILKNIVRKELKMPILTKKIVFLVPTGLIAELLIFLAVLTGTGSVFSFAFWLLAVDILTPLIISFIVLVLQVPTVIIRNQFILKKARIKRQQMEKLIAIGITGSYGKTSAKEFLATILSEKFKVLKTSNHQNSEVGISQTILKRLSPNHEVFIAEMGAYGRGGIKLLSGIVKPKIGVLTGINEQHMSLFGSQENIIKTKYELIESLPKEGFAVFNGDNDYCLELYRKTSIDKKLYRTQKLFLGMELESDIWAENIKLEKNNISFDVCVKEGERTSFKVNILGGQNIPNILSAVLVAQKLGMSLAEIANACWKIKPEQGSMKLMPGKQDPYILNSSYSANSEGVIADLNYLKTWSGKKAIVMPCLIELGKASKNVHRRIGKKIAEVCDLAVITTEDYFEEIKQAAVSSGMKESRILFVEDSRDIIGQINLFSSPGDVALLEGRVSKKVIKALSK